MDGFAFDLGQTVRLALSNELGVVRGRAKYIDHCDSYFVRYVAADGRQVEGWLDASAITSV